MASRDPQADDVDFFPTQPWAGRAGAEIVRLIDPSARTVWENACGAGHLVHAIRDMFDVVHASDAYLYDGNVIHDVLGDAPPAFGPVDWVITNPPFSNILAFIRHAWATSRRGVALLMPARVMEGVERHALLYGECPVTLIAPFSERLPMHKGCYDPSRSTAAFYAWFIWLKPCLRPHRFMVRMPRLGVGPRSSAPSGTSRPDAGCGGFDWRPGIMPIPPGTKRRLFRRSDLRLAMGGEALAIVADLTAKGQPVLAPTLLDLLARVAVVPQGVTPHMTAYPGGLLATLRGMGLVEAGEPDPVFGDRRYTVTADGRAMLQQRGRS